jgi:hypothetical protein
MLRSVVIVLGAVSTLLGGVLLLFREPGGVGPLIGGLLLLVGVLFERVIYKPVEAGRPGPGWVKTAERFISDATGKPVTVYVEPATGERRYVEE